MIGTKLILLTIFILSEIKFDEQIRAYGRAGNINAFYGNKIMHNMWFNIMRGVLVASLLWLAPPVDVLALLSEISLYLLYYWIVFDTLFASYVLGLKPWFLGQSSRIDRIFPHKTHIFVWIIKILLTIGAGLCVHFTQ